MEVFFGRDSLEILGSPGVGGSRKIGNPPKFGVHRDGGNFFPEIGGVPQNLRFSKNWEYPGN